MDKTTTSVFDRLLVGHSARPVGVTRAHGSRRQIWNGRSAELALEQQGNRTEGREERGVRIADDDSADRERATHPNDGSHRRA